MKKLFYLVAVLLLTTVSASAQDYPRAEIFGGYSHFSADINLNNPFDLNGNPFFQQREGLLSLHLPPRSGIFCHYHIWRNLVYRRKFG